MLKSVCKVVLGKVELDLASVDVDDVLPRVGLGLVWFDLTWLVWVEWVWGW